MEFCAAPRFPQPHPLPTKNQRSPCGCREVCFPQVSAPTANFLLLHTDAPRAHQESSDLHLQRNKINSTKRCLFFLLFAPRQTYCGSWDPEWVIKAISMVGELGTSGAFTIKNKENCNSSFKGERAVLRASSHPSELWAASARGRIRQRDRRQGSRHLGLQGTVLDEAVSPAPAFPAVRPGAQNLPEAQFPYWQNSGGNWNPPCTVGVKLRGENLLRTGARAGKSSIL